MSLFSGGICGTYCGKDVEIDVQLNPQPGKASYGETGDVITAVLSGLEPTTFYSASIRAKTDLGVYGPPLETKALFKTLPSAPQTPSITTTTTKTGIIVVSLYALRVQNCRAWNKS